MTTTSPASRGLDPRGPQFAAAVTSALLVVILFVPTPVAVVLTSLQASLFATGVIRGVERTPASWIFRTVVRPRLSAPVELEEPEPPRFAQGIGLVFTVAALIGFVSGADVAAQVAVGLALVAALLNALFRLCLGCEVYLRLKRATA